MKYRRYLYFQGEENMEKRVVVTGIGIIVSNGKNKEEFWENCYTGVSGLKRCTLFDTSNFSTSIAGEISDERYPYDEKSPNEKSRIDYMIDECIQDMLADGNLTSKDISSLGDGAYLSFATSLGTNYKLLQYEKEINKYGEGNDEWLLTISNLLPGIKKKLGIEGGSFTTTTACAASATAVGIGYDLIQSGKANLVVAGGADPLNEFSYYGFNSLRALSHNVCKPFDINRDGINIGEGCGFIILESLENALQRKAKIYAEILGYGINNEAYHITSPDPKGVGAKLSMMMACGYNQEIIDSIDYINAHGTGTKLNDSMELNAIQQLFHVEKAKVFVSSIKGLVGHCLAAAGIIELILTILSIEREVCIGNSNMLCVMTKETSENVYLLKNNIALRVEKALSNNFAFAGNTASILISRYHSEKVLTK